MKQKAFVFIVLIMVAQSRLLLPHHMANVQDAPKTNATPTEVQTSCTVVKSTDLGALPATQTVYSGYMSTGGKSGLAFIFYGSQKAQTAADIVNYPTVIWLNGGPGSSSQLGNFLELGPLAMQKDGTLKVNPFSWNVEYNVMFVDQPVGTGFSFAAVNTDIPTDQNTVGSQFIYAWKQFLTADNGCVKTQKLDKLATSSWFLFGESYAGKYVPAIAQAALANKDFKYPLKGIGIGDGFTDPASIMQEMPSFGFNMGLIDYQERQQNEKTALFGSINIKRSKWLDAQQSFDDTVEFIQDQSGGVNEYNIFVFGSYDDLEAPVVTYLSDVKTKTLLGFNPDIPYGIGSKAVYDALSNDFMKSDCVGRVEDVLSQGLPVIIYNGQFDLIVPNPGTSRWVYNLNYSKSGDFRKTDFTPWTIKDNVVGYKKSAGNLEYRIVNKAGHLVPMDQPEAALDLVKTFVDAHK